MTNNGIFNKQTTKSKFNEGGLILGGVIGTQIIGPILFQGCLIGSRYLKFLQYDIWGLLIELQLAISE